MEATGKLIKLDKLLLHCPLLYKPMGNVVKFMEIHGLW